MKIPIEGCKISTQYEADVQDCPRIEGLSELVGLLEKMWEGEIT